MEYIGKILKVVGSKGSVQQIEFLTNQTELNGLIEFLITKPIN